jgi:hypothetical protein
LRNEANVVPGLALHVEPEQTVQEGDLIALIDES